MVRELPATETHLAAAALLELRPRFETAERLVAAADAQRPDGYRIAASFDDGDEEAAAAAGFRIVTMLAWRRTLYVDDLSCRAAHRRKGHARALMDWLLATARAEGCDELHLDSAHGPERAAAHRLYFNCGLRIAAHHFSTDC